MNVSKVGNKVTVPLHANALERQSDIREAIRQLQAELDAIKAGIFADTEASGAPPITEDTLRTLIQARHKRREIFPADLFGDPAWDILLELYACALGSRKTTVTRLSLAAGVPETTGIRWMEKLDKVALIRREQDERDRRRVWVTLTHYGCTLMDRYFKGLGAQSFL